MSVDVFGHTLSFMPDNFLDESLVNFLFGEERDAGVSCIMRAVSVIDRLSYWNVNNPATNVNTNIVASQSYQIMEHLTKSTPFSYTAGC